MPDTRAVRYARRIAQVAQAAAAIFVARLKTWRSREFVLAAVLFPLAFGTGLWWADGLRLRGHAVPGVVVLDEPVGGFSKAALTEWLEAHRLRIADHRLRVRIESHVFNTSPAELGVQLQVEDTRAAILASGRSGGLLRRIRERAARAWGETATVPPMIVADDRALAAVALQWQQSALEQPIEGSIKLKGKKYVPSWPKAGATIDLPALREAVVATLLAGGDTLNAPTVQVSPKLSREAVQRSLDHATRLSARALRLKHPTDEEHLLLLSPQDLRAALRWEIENNPTPHLRFSFALDKLGKSLARQRGVLEVTPRDASFEVNSRDQVTILPSATGSKIDEAKLPEVLLALAESDDDVAVLPMLAEVAPALTTEDAQQQNIRGLVSTFTTGHPCCQPRVKNIHRIADLLDGVLVRAGSTFSVNEFVGPRAVANGFFPAPTIVLGEIEDTVGGGVSQFATTIFNAVLTGGYEIIERQPHSYYFKRYPAGHEATLSFPKPDFIFRNDTNNGLLIKTHYGSTFIRVSIYGDNEGRRVKNSHSKNYDIEKPKVVFVANDELPADEEKVKDRGQHGFKIAVSRVVTLADGQSKKEERVVAYKARDRVLEVHSCKIPEGEEGYTGEDCPEISCDPADADCEPPCAADDKACIIARSKTWTPPATDEEEPPDE